MWVEEKLVHFRRIPDKHLTHLFPEQTKQFGERLIFSKVDAKVYLVPDWTKHIIFLNC